MSVFRNFRERLYTIGWQRIKIGEDPRSVLGNLTIPHFCSIILAEKMKLSWSPNGTAVFDGGRVLKPFSERRRALGGPPRRMARRVGATAWILLAGCCLSCGPSRSRDIYLLIGQSNMEGRAPIENADQVLLPGVELLKSHDRWEPAAHPLNRYSTVLKDLEKQRLSPGWAFARAMRERRPGRRVGLIVNAQGGSSIDEWAAGARCYEEAIRRARAAAKAGTLQAVLWHQGEYNVAYPDGYLGKLRDLAERLRRDLRSPCLIFVAGQIKPDESTRVINAQIAALPDVMPRTAVAPSTGLTVFDTWHFDGASTRELGRRFAEAVLSLMEDGTAVPDRVERPLGEK